MMKSGRRKKTYLNLINQTVVSKPRFDFSRFQSVLGEVSLDEPDPTKWAVKKEWVAFHKIYFNVASATITHP